MKTDELIVYRHLEDAQLLYETDALMESGIEARTGSPEEISKARAGMYHVIHKLIELAGSSGFYGNLWKCYLTNLLVNNENSYSVATEIRGEVQGSINGAALHDIGIFRDFYTYDFEPLCRALDVPEFDLVLDYRACSEKSCLYNTRIRDRICNLSAHFDESASAEEMKEMLTQFYKDYGVGRFGLHKAFRVRREEDGTVVIDPILNILHVSLKDLVGYENAKRKLVENTTAFVEGRPANNCLLYGDAGTGKSSCIKAIANEYYDRGLRIIEIYRHQFKELNDVIAQIKNRNYRFIVYMDDLSFEDFETEYKYLKAVIEGGLEKKPSNVLIYATSNRRHLIRESFADRDGQGFSEKHASDTMQEKLSLSNRFGVTICFESPGMEEFQHIVSVLAERSGIEADPDELRLAATRWEMLHGGLSGRTAQQFIDHLLGTEDISGTQQAKGSL
ncbi:MAG: ATP-binding protein [Lachnospiraceae bacterium]|jgi:predicted AAA+ superfamily ATPase|nr:ATP-binding protein [Lachnospiraceae bacterium]